MLRVLREMTGSIEVMNGMERGWRAKLPREYEPGSDGEWAARIVQLGELEAAVEGVPRDPFELWLEEQPPFLAELIALAGEVEVTEGHSQWGRQGHARQSIEVLNRISRETRWMAGQLDPEDRKWLERGIASLSLDAFYAGRHYQQALNKPVEAHSIRHSVYGKRGAEMTNAERAKRRNPVHTKALARMAELVLETHLSARSAAEICAREGYGNPGTIRGWWKDREKVGGSPPAPPTKS
jgi:hypothetical protein